MATKIVRGLLISLLVLLFVVYPIWVALPRESHGHTIYECKKEAQERFDAVQAKANSPETNGYLAPEFRDWWVPHPEAPATPPPGGLAVFEWGANHTEAGLGEAVDHRGLLERKDPKYLKARRDFEKYLPAFKRAMLAEVFALPRERPGNQVMNLIKIRVCAQAISGYVDSLVAEERGADALDIARCGFVLGFNMQNHAFLINDMIGVAIQQITFESLVNSITPEIDSTSEDWRRLAHSLKRSILPPGQIYRSMQAELLFADHAFEEMKAGRADWKEYGEGLVWLNIPGMLGREHRIYHNVQGQLLEEFKAGRDPDLGPFTDFGFVSLLTGRTGYVAALVIPNFVRAGSHIEINRRSLTGAVVAAGLVAYRKESGHYPETLEGLKKVNVELPEDTSFVHYERTGTGATVTVDIPEEAIAVTAAVDRMEYKWFKCTPDSGVFTL